MQGIWEDLPGLKIHKTAFLLTQRVGKSLNETFGLSVPHFMALMVVAHKEHCDQSEMAKIRGLSEAAISKMMDSLIKKNLVKRREDKENRRKYILELTKDGEEMVKKATKVVKGELDEVFGVLTADEKVTLDRIIDKITQSAGIKKESYA